MKGLSHHYFYFKILYQTINLRQKPFMIFYNWKVTYKYDFFVIKLSYYIKIKPQKMSIKT